jgi:dUTP pyrophosphatase
MARHVTCIEADETPYPYLSDPCNPCDLWFLSSLLDLLALSTYHALTMIVKVKKLDPSATVPCYAHPGDAGMDLCSNEDASIEPGATRLVKTGITIELPANTEAQVRPRSGLALKQQVSVLNTPGTIDEGYRGEVGVILINHGKSVFQIEKGMRIAQMVVKPVLRVEIEEVEQLSDTARGEGGFGSTGH